MQVVQLDCAPPQANYVGLWTTVRRNEKHERTFLEMQPNTNVTLMRRPIFGGLRQYEKNNGESMSINLYFGVLRTPNSKN